MPIDVEKVVGAKLPSMSFDCTPDKLMLYALGVGVEPEGDDLVFVYENGLKALPTFGVVPPFPALAGILGVPGADINPIMILHGEQYLEVRNPIPTEGPLVSKPIIANVYDKGKGALVEVEVTTEDKDGNVLPDVYLLPETATAEDLAFKVHSDIGTNLVAAFDVKEKRKIAKDALLKDNDVIKFHHK